MSAAKTPPRPITRLMLVTPELADIETFEPMLEAAVSAGDVAAVVIRLAPADERTRLSRAKALVQIVQAEGAAALLCGEDIEDIVGRSGADGIHLAKPGDDIAEIVGRFQPEKIVGCAPQSRDGAMSAGEAGCDYVLFGEDSGGAPFPATLERIEWWVPIFETPCVGFAQTLDDVAPLAALDAEFVALGEALWRHDGGPATAMAGVGATLSLVKAPTP
jgi:thiamine-phosphate pyrophosphorylase